MKNTGTAIVAILIVVGAIALFSGILEGIFPAQQASPLAQEFVGPTQPVNTFPITTLGELKDQKQKLDVISATTDIVAKEYDEKIGASQQAYNKLIGTIDNPGLFGAAISALLAGYLTKLYKDKTMYSEVEVEKIKKETNE